MARTFIGDTEVYPVSIIHQTEKVYSSGFFGLSQYFESAPSSASWLKADGAYASGAIYPDFYKWLTDIQSGAKTVEGVSVKTTAEAYDDYDYVLNLSANTFRLPVLNGSESLIDLTQYTDVQLTITSQSTLVETTSLRPARNGKYIVTAWMVGGTGNSWMYFSRDDTSEQNMLDIIIAMSAQNYTVGCEARRGDAINFSCLRVSRLQSARFYPFVGNGDLYYYVGDTIKDPDIIDANAALTQLANKASKDLSNITADAKGLIANLPMPSSLTINVPFGASGTEYVAPADGYYYAYVTAQATGGWLNITNMTAGSMTAEGTGWTKGAIPKVFMPVSKGSIVRFYYDVVTVDYFKFCYAEGAK